MTVVKLLAGFNVDRGAGVTVDGSTQLVILSLKTTDGSELAVAISKVDAMVLAHQLTAAAREASSHMHR